MDKITIEHLSIRYSDGQESLRDVNFGMQVRSDMNHRILERLTTEGIHIVPPPAPPAEPDPVKTAETVLALADLVERDRPDTARRKPAKPAPSSDVKGAER
jgi:hypothetical protein